VAVLTGAGHAPFVEARELFRAELAAFLKT
jgi:pimeloyl-ACP methyl ester carboxylesterase